MIQEIKGCILRSGSFLSSVQLSQCGQVLQGHKKKGDREGEREKELIKFFRLRYRVFI